MNACGIDFRQARDRSLKLAFDRPNPLDLLLGIGHAEVHLIEELVARSAALDDAGSGERDSLFVDARLRDEHGLAAVTELVGHLRVAQLGGHRRSVFGIEIREKDFVAGLVRAEEHAETDRR